MDREEILKRLVQIIKPFAKDESFLANSTNEDINLLDDLQVNSSRMIDIIIKLEDEFDIEIGDEELNDATTLRSVIDFVQKKLGS